MNKNFTTLLNEAQFTYEILTSGITQLGKVNYAKKGAYFSSFISISTGLERIGKLCVILDFYIKNEGKFPEENTLKNKIGHDLEKLYENSKNIIADNGIELYFLRNLDSQIHKDIISILSKFAKGDRYSNIDFIVKSKNQSDPIYDWYTKVEQVIFDNRVTNKKKENITNNAKFIGDLMRESASALYFGETGEQIRSIEESSFKTGMAESNIKFRQLYVAQIIRYWVEILRDLQYKAMSFRQNEIPFFGEIFAIFYNEDSYLITRRNYERLR
ncbi:hypothetical protein [Flavobacterium sp.]|uniref:hypothetical protein n=1 Tax=Flavobacterium sp. TaxID=239 RepID=UPI0037500C06